VGGGCNRDISGSFSRGKRQDGEKKREKGKNIRHKGGGKKFDWRKGKKKRKKGFKKEEYLSMEQYTPLRRFDHV